MRNAINLDHFMRPKSIAIVGATVVAGRAGYNLVANLVKSNFSGKIYPVNPRQGEILGMRVYSRIKDIPDDVDLAVVATSPQLVPDILLQSAEKGIEAVVISSAGFADDGEEGKKLQQQLVRIAKEQEIAIIGPNTQGLINVAEKLVLVSTTTDTPPTRKGMNVAWVCQTAFFYWDWVLANLHLGLSKAIDLGNMCDVGHTELLDYLGADPETHVIALHIEGIQDGKRFVEVATREVPVVMVTAVGQELNKRLAESLGAAGYITKPFKSAELLEIVNDLLPTS